VALEKPRGIDFSVEMIKFSNRLLLSLQLPAKNGLKERAATAD